MRAIALWRYNKTTGFWEWVRSCDTALSKQWLEVFKKDEPKAFFKLAKNRPNLKPRM